MHRPVANIKMYPKEISYNDSGWSELCQDRLQWRTQCKQFDMGELASQVTGSKPCWVSCGMV